MMNSVSKRRAPACGARYIRRKNQISFHKEINFFRILILRRNELRELFPMEQFHREDRSRFL